MSEKFYSPEDMKPLYDKVVSVYQTAFADEPWNEVSKCVDSRRRCVGGLSAVAIGSMCGMCGERPLLPAYERDELVGRFEDLAASRPVSWYVERTGGDVALDDGDITLAAMAWLATPETIATEKYADVPKMSVWMEEKLSTEPVIWLDEVFANRVLRPSGNLRRFGAMCTGFMEQLGNDTLAFRTINERMTAAAERDFGDRATVFRRRRVDVSDRRVEVPDRRDFVIIRGETK